MSNSSQNCVKNMSKFSQDMRFGHKFGLGGPIDLRSMRLNCILHDDLLRDTHLDHFAQTDVLVYMLQLFVAFF